MVEQWGLKLKTTTEIPSKVNTEQRLNEHLSLTVVPIYLGMRVWGFFTSYALSQFLFLAHWCFLVPLLSQ